MDKKGVKYASAISVIIAAAIFMAGCGTGTEQPNYNEPTNSSTSSVTPSFNSRIETEPTDTTAEKTDIAANTDEPTQNPDKTV